MALQEKQLGQLRPADTTVASIYSPPASTTAIIRTIIICNTGAANANYRIFIDDDGSTYDTSTAIFYDAGVAKNTTDIIEIHGAMNNSSGNLAVRTDTPNDITFTVFGMEIGA
jgi:hypothetical protein